MLEIAGFDNDYDSPWKEALELYFPQFMQLLLPHIHAQIDWTSQHEFLETELQKIVRDAHSGRAYTDKLIKVYTLAEEEIWVLIHIEIQGRAEKNFNERMYRYHRRLTDCYPDNQIASFALLTDQRNTLSLGCYQQNFWGTQHQFTFPVINLLDWESKVEQLENDSNPFSLVLLAQLIAHNTCNQHRQRKDSKFNLIRLLYNRGYERREVLELFRFIDWMLQLPKALEIELTHEIIQLEEQKMPYITNIERFALERGEQIGTAKGIGIGEMRGEMRGEIRGEIRGEANTLLKLLKLKFNFIPEWVEDKVNSADKEQLDQWVEKILTAQTLDNVISEQH